jgi:hypothetical protein
MTSRIEEENARCVRRTWRNASARRELARFPELQAAGAAFAKTLSVEILERIEEEFKQIRLRAQRDGDRDFCQAAKFTLV